MEGEREGKGRDGWRPGREKMEVRSAERRERESAFHEVKGSKGRGLLEELEEK